MPVPDFQSLMRPVLNALADGAEAALSEVRQRVASAEGLTPEDVKETTPEGRQPRFSYNVSWATIYMERAGLVARVRRGVYRLTEEGERPGIGGSLRRRRPAPRPTVRRPAPPSLQALRNASIFAGGSRCTSSAISRKVPMFRRPPSVPRVSVGTWSQKPCRRSIRRPLSRPQGVQRGSALVGVALHPLEKRVVTAPVRQVVALVGEGVVQQGFPTCCS